MLTCYRLIEPGKRHMHVLDIPDLPALHIITCQARSSQLDKDSRSILILALTNKFKLTIRSSHLVPDRVHIFSSLSF